MGYREMKSNVGQLNIKWFVAAVLTCLVIGILIYSRFSFVQRAAPQDTTTLRLNDLGKKISETQVKVEQGLSDLEKKGSATEKTLSQLQKKVDRLQPKTEQGASKRDSKKHD